MSAPVFLYLVLPLPILFVIHDAEEVIKQHCWVLSHRETLTKRFPRIKHVLNHLSQLDTKAFAFATFEELIVILLVTSFVLVQGPFATEIWTCIFMAFSIHLFIHLTQAILVKGYVPEVITSIFLLPYAIYGLHSIGLVMSTKEMIACGIAGIMFMILNLMFAHKFGIQISRIIDNRF